MAETTPRIKGNLSIPSWSTDYEWASFTQKELDELGKLFAGIFGKDEP